MSEFSNSADRQSETCDSVTHELERPYSPTPGHEGSAQDSPTATFDANPSLSPPPLPGTNYHNRLFQRNLASDEQLLDQYRRGDRASFSRLMERYQKELFHFLVRFLGDRSAAEDIFQETFLQVHQSASSFDISRRFRPWLFTIAANKARDLRRSQARRSTNPLQAPISVGDEQGTPFMDMMASGNQIPGEALERQELAERVRSTVREMPESLREILLLSYFDQFPYKQIGDILDIPLGTVKSRLHTAVADFAIRWKSVNKGARIS